MRKFEHVSAESFEDAALRLKSESAVAIAGGTDLMNTLSKALLPKGPETVVDLKTIPDAKGIEDKGATVEIGALTTLADVCKSEVINQKVPILAEAAHSVATALVRNAGTIGGNICQDVRCWYYRYPHEGGGRFFCQRKGGEECYAIHGENRYHSIFGGMKAHTTPCTADCPAGTDIPGYMACIRNNDWEGAADIFFKFNPMPSMTSRICAHPCKDGCNQCVGGDSVNIPAVERNLGDFIMAHKEKYYAAPAASSGKKCAVIGAGPGGLAAAFYLRRAGNEVTVYDEHEKPGGILQYGIPHYRLPKNLVDDYCNTLRDIMGINFTMNTAVGRDISLEQIKSEYDAVYLSTGAWQAPVMGLDGENLTQFGLDFLVEVNTYLKKAIGEEVIVFGGGNVAIDVAVTAKRLGAKKVTILCRRQVSDMTAAKDEVEEAQNEGIEIHGGWGLGKVVTDSEGKVCGLECKKCDYVVGEDGKSRPVYDESIREVFNGSMIILATGQKVDVSFLGEKLMGQLKSKRGLIDADVDTGKTGMKGIYAGGDAVTGPKLAIHAVRAGRAAAATMNHDLGVTVPEFVSSSKCLSYDVDAVEQKESVKLSMRAVEDRNLTDEDTASLTSEQAKHEAGRCMNCGCYSVNASDITPVLIALDADIVTTERTIKAKDLFAATLKVSDKLNPGELVKKIIVPDMSGFMTHYEKLRIRKSLDFALVSLASVYRKDGDALRDVKLVFGGVAPVPRELPEVNALLEGKAPTEELAEAAGALSVKDAIPMRLNNYKVTQAKVLVSRFVTSTR